jgi:hypothetical protein
VLLSQAGACSLTSSLGCQLAVCSGGHSLAQLQDPGVLALSQRGMRAPCATFLPSLELEAPSSPGPRGHWHSTTW